jgi:hypothetical protein
MSVVWIDDIDAAGNKRGWQLNTLQVLIGKVIWGCRCQRGRKSSLAGKKSGFSRGE